MCFFCNRISEERHAAIRDYLQPFTCAAGDALFREGDDPPGLWSVCTGQLNLIKQGDEGQHLVTRIVYPGGMVGHRSVLAGTPMAGTGCAHEETRGVFMARPALEELFAREPEFRAAIMRLMAEDLEHAESLAASMAYNDARSRVLAALAEFRRVRERVVGTLAGWEFSIPRKELAELTGLSVEGVVRTLKKLEADGVISIKGRRIKVVDPTAVRSQCLHHCTERQSHQGEVQCRCLFDV